MFEEIENPPNEETQMVTSPEEANQVNPENSQQEEQPEKEEEEEENKKTVKEEKRPHESTEEDDDPVSARKEKKLKQSVDTEEVVGNLRSAVLDPNTLAPFLVRLEHDVKTQMGFFEGMIGFHEKNSVYPFESEEDMEDFINNWLQVRVPRLDFEQTLRRVWGKYLATGISVGEKLDSLSPDDRQVFLLGNRILYAYYKEKKDRKRQVQETHGAKSSFNKAVNFGGSHMPQNKEPEKSLEQQYKEIDQQWEMVVARKLKMKLKISEYEEEEKKRKQSKTPEERKRHNIPEEKPSEKHEAKASEKPEEKPNEDPDETWSEANFEILNKILQSLHDYSFIMTKFPYDDVVDMDDFVKNWIGLDITPSDCLEVIRRLKKNYKKKFWQVIDHGLIFGNQIQEQLYESSNSLWSGEAHLNSDDEEEEEKEHSGDEEEVKNHVEGGGNLELEHSNVQRRPDFSELEYDPAMRSMLPFLVKNTYAQDLGVFSDVMPVSPPVPPAKIHPPVLPPLPRFHVNKKEDNRAPLPLKKRRPRILPPVPRFHDTKKEDGSKPRPRVLPPVPRFHDTKKEDGSKPRPRVLPPVPRFHDTKKEDGSNPRPRVLPPVPRFHDTKKEDGSNPRPRVLPPVPRFHDTKKEDGSNPRPRVLPPVPRFHDTKKEDGSNPRPRVLPPVPRFHDTKKEDGSNPRPRVLPPVPRFHDTKKEDNSQHKAGSGEDSSLVKRTDPGGPNSSCDDPEKPHDENPDGGNEAPEEPKSDCEKIEDTKKE